jgi:hypothetical protein
MFAEMVLSLATLILSSTLYVETVVALNTFHLSPLSYVYTANISRGAENPLIWSQQLL